jgi:hypothetical protein
MFLLNGNPLQLDIPFTHNGIQYPANWLRLSSPQDKAAIGITEAAEPEHYDDRFYWGVDNPKDLDGLKAQWINQVNQTAYSLLVQTDWMIVRKAETNVDVPTETLTYRAAIRTAAVTNRTAITNASDVPALVSVATNMYWPSGA